MRGQQRSRLDPIFGPKMPEQVSDNADRVADDAERNEEEKCSDHPRQSLVKDRNCTPTAYQESEETDDDNLLPKHSLVCVTHPRQHLIVAERGCFFHALNFTERAYDANPMYEAGYRPHVRGDSIGLLPEDTLKKEK
jgi:hypothetical protein